jgi:hypothetical protein
VLLHDLMCFMICFMICCSYRSKADHHHPQLLHAVLVESMLSSGSTSLGQYLIKFKHHKD